MNSGMRTAASMVPGASNCAASSAVSRSSRSRGALTIAVLSARSPRSPEAGRSDSGRGIELGPAGRPVVCALRASPAPGGRGTVLHDLEPLLEHDLALERAVHRALGRDLHQARALFLGKLLGQLDHQLEAGRCPAVGGLVVD